MRFERCFRVSFSYLYLDYQLTSLPVSLSYWSCSSPLAEVVDWSSGLVRAKSEGLQLKVRIFFSFIASGNLIGILSIAEKMQIEKDALRDKEIQVVSSTRARL